jgi:hypothetical protein
MALPSPKPYPTKLIKTPIYGSVINEYNDMWLTLFCRVYNKGLVALRSLGFLAPSD